jgi:Na+/H+-dicarboxylate symporter
MESTPRLIPLPLYTQVLIAVACGTLLGVIFGQEPYLGGLKNEHLGWLGLLLVTLLKTLAIPLIFFAILDALVRTSLPLRQGAKLLLICFLNVSVAMTIGLVIMNTWQPGLAWNGHVEDLLNVVPTPKPSAGASATVETGAQSPIEYLASYIPRTIMAPFSSGNIIGVVLLALCIGATLRRLRGHTDQGRGVVQTLVRGIEHVYSWLVQTRWIIRRYRCPRRRPQVVGRQASVSSPSSDLLAMLSDSAIHALGYYPLVAWLIGKKSPKVYLGQGADAIMTAVSCNSSLAAVPVTLRCLDRMQVSPQSARLAACVGTNLNNDGITLYEAMAALFLAQALGFDLPMDSQVLIVAASMIAGAGVAGIPEAGMIVLPLVLSAAGLPPHVIGAAIPLIMTVDWIIARARSGVNVLSDMLVAILLDVGRITPATEPSEIQYGPDGTPPTEPQIS